MSALTHGLAVFAIATLATHSLAQTNFPEVEPNSAKSEATAVTNIIAGDTITGTSTGTITTLASTLLTTVDTYRIRTAALPIGIYRHRLTLTTATGIQNTGSIRGLDQNGTAGTASTGGTAGTVDSEIQLSSGTPVFNQWYGFGKQEQMYYRVTGTTATTAAYTATMSTSTVAFTTIAPSFEASAPITITTVGQATADTDIHVYDGSLNALAGFDNDDEGPNGTTLQSRITRTFAPGIYFLAVGNFNAAWNFPCPPDEDYQTGFLMDFPDIIVCSVTTTGDRDLSIQGCNGIFLQSNQVPATEPFSIQWFMFAVTNGAPVISSPANDNCAGAIPFNASGSHTTKLSTATNDGAASCDPGGTSSRDVWYSFTATGALGGTLAISTCGTTLDTCVSVHNTCGGADVLCNDDCGGAPCAGTASCLSGIALTSNQFILVRVSDKGLGGCGDVTTTFTYVPTPPPPPVNDNCSAPIALSGPGVYPFDTTAATSGQGTTGSCGNAPVKNLWYAYAATTSGTLTVSTCGQVMGPASTDTEIWIYQGAGCPGAASIACNDDACASLQSSVSTPVTCGTVYMLEVGNYDGQPTANMFGTFTVTEVGTTCAVGTAECIGDTVAACPCSGGGGSLVPNPGAAGNGCANSAFPAGAHLAAAGNAVDNAGDTLVLTCSNMPGPGLFFQSNGLAGPIVNFNDGILCAAIGIVRMGVVFPTAGVGSYPGGLTPNPIHIAGAPVLLGGSPTPETKHYQCWYRDITPGFCNVAGHNMSNGLAIVWAP